MRKVIISMLSLFFLAVSIFISCNRDENLSNSILKGVEKFEKPSNFGILSRYVNRDWSDTAILKSKLKTDSDTNFMINEMKKNAVLWGLKVPVLKFVDDPNSPTSTDNAVSYPNNRIYYGYAFYDEAKSKSPDNIVNAMILAHEYGHQLQFVYNLPIITESTYRPDELEADGFAGYYLRSSKGFNKSDFSQIAAATNYAYEIGDYDVNHEGHHGKPSQRRAAVSLGFILGKYNLSAKEFDNRFFKYYPDVLKGTIDQSKQYSKIIANPDKIDKAVILYMDKLKSIASGQISVEEFKNINLE